MDKPMMIWWMMNDYFDKSKFTECENLRVVDNWNSMNKLTEDYELIITKPILAPKVREGYNKPLKSKCPVAVWDIGGVDILTGYQKHANY